ncbi:MAG: L-threonine synthase [Bryobacterales bacterium]|jgi:threonine synthase|nr:L-threonine synthase [Bryobacterales bacterium]
MPNVSHLECSLCATRFEPNQIHNLCSCGGTLYVRYDLPAIKATWTRNSLRSARPDLWRYLPILPPQQPESIVSLGEGMTPLIRARRLGGTIGAQQLWVKDEGLNPTASFKARGMTTAITMARELGIRKIAIPSAGNAASAAAAYAAAAGMEAHIFMPADVPQANYIESKTLGAIVTLVDGLISDCARIVAERKDREGWFDMSTLKEPYRVEGKKTMGYEVAEQFDWELPDAIFYPTGGGVGMIGMWKAFDEMEQLGWISSKRPKMIAVQAAGCQPIVQAFEQSASRAEFWQNASTLAAGLRVPKPLGDALILNIIRASKGTAIAISDEEILDGGRELASLEGIFAAPEGAACVTAARKLIANQFLEPTDRIVLYNTGSGLKYLDAYSPRK